jgi:ElaB/YqjD/DUF883 family membrane-anchored ribosome-binding protein
LENDGGKIWKDPGGDAPKADEVLSQKRAEQAAQSFMPGQSEQLAALKAEVERLRESIGQVASGTSQLASAEFKELASAAEKKLKENVFLSVGIAAAIGYLWGRSGR